MKTALRALFFVSFALIAQQALAVQPTHEVTPRDFTNDYYSCGFHVHSHTTGFLTDIYYFDAQGVFHDFEVGPQLKIVLTTDAGKSITVNTSGPADLTYFPPDYTTLMIVGRGDQFWEWDPDTQAAGLFLTHGRWVYMLGPSNGPFGTELSRAGTKIDLCAQLL